MKSIPYHLLVFYELTQFSKFSNKSILNDLGQIYYCEFWHCEIDSDGKWGRYEDIGSDCKACEAKCSRDPNCDTIECDYFDSRPCTWRTRIGAQVQGCDIGQRRVYSDQYKTCVKPDQGRSLHDHKFLLKIE